MKEATLDRLRFLISDKPQAGLQLQSGDAWHVEIAEIRQATDLQVQSGNIWSI